MLKSLYVEKVESTKKRDSIYSVLYAEFDDGRKVCVSFERSVLMDMLDISPSRYESIKVGDKLYIWEQKNEKVSK